MSSGEHLDLIKTRKYFYRDYYRRAANALWVALALIIVLSLLVIYFYIERPLPTFYATSSNGKLVALTPLSTPNYGNTPLIP